MRLVVADGEPMLADLFDRYLSRVGYDVVTVTCAAECQIAAGEADLLVLDASLRSCRALLTHMRGDPQLRRIPVVLMAGDNSRERLLRLVVPPVVACLQKPFRLASLLQAIRSHAQPNACLLEPGCIK